MVTTQSTISDELFVGRVPELAKEPFYNLKKLTFEADKFPRHVANFLIGRATSIEELNVILDGLNQDQFKGKPKLYVQSITQKLIIHIKICYPCIMAVRVVEFSSNGYKIRKIFA